MMKRFLVRVLIISMLIFGSTFVRADGIEEYPVVESDVEDYSYMSSISLSIGFPDGNGLANVIVYRKIGVTQSLEATITVYRKVGSSWVYVGSNSGSSTTTGLSVSVDFSITKGTTYKAIAEVTATGPGGSENDTIEDQRTY